MKTLNLLTLTVVTGSLLAFTAQAGILGSKHDFSSGYSWNNNPADPATVCGVCHTPHHADPNAGPLWGHDPVSAGATWKMYGSTTLVGGVGVNNSPGANIHYTVPTAPNASSLACLSCHDGSVAINAYGNPAAPGGAPNRATPQYLSGTIFAISEGNQNLTHSHPISFHYQDVVGIGTTKNQFIWDQSHSVLTPDNMTGFTPGPLMDVQHFLLDGQGNVECSSCHDVHNGLGSAYNPSSNPSMIKINGTKGGVGSLLCLSCHNK